MADPALVAHIRETMPKFNSKLAEGFAVSQLPQAARYVDMLFKAVARSFPKDVKYLGGRKCTAMEEYREITKNKTQKTLKKNSKRTYDIAQSGLFMMMYDFEFKGKKLLPRPLYLPYVTQGGHIMISGSRYSIAPTLADRVISIQEKSIFVRLIKTRFMVYRLMQHYLIDGHDFSTHVAKSKIYQKVVVKDRSDTTRVDADSTMPHYLLCKYGLTQAFQMFGNCTPIVGDDVSITKEKYPTDEWHICASSRSMLSPATPPVGWGGNPLFYQPSKLRVAIRKSERSPMVEKLLGGFFYLADMFPDKMRHYGDMEKPLFWVLLLGYIVAPGTHHAGKLQKEMDTHIRSLDEYIDPIIKQQLEKIGMHVDDVYQLFAILTERFNDLLLGGSNKLSSMYDKEMNVLYFVLYDISKAIVELGFRMMKLAEKPNLEEKEVINALTSQIKPGLIYNINKNVGSVSPNSYPGDNMALKITTLLVPQQASNKKATRGHSSLQLSDPINNAHSSIAEIGAYANLPKSQPSGHFRASLYTQLDEDNVVVQNPKFIKLFEEIQTLLDLP